MGAQGIHRTVFKRVLTEQVIDGVIVHRGNRCFAVLYIGYLSNGNTQQRCKFHFAVFQDKPRRDELICTNDSQHTQISNGHKKSMTLPLYVEKDNNRLLLTVFIRRVCAIFIFGYIAPNLVKDQQTLIETKNRN